MGVEFGALILVSIVTFIFYMFNPKAYKWWEFFVPFIVVIISIFISKAIINHINVSFDEYWGETIVEVYEEEPWNRWVSKTCSRQVACGTDSDGKTIYCTEYYDCSYQEDNGPEWYVRTNLGNKFNINEKRHDSIVNVFGTGKKIVNTRTNHSARSRAAKSSGTKFEGQTVGKKSNVLMTKWCGNDEKRQGVFTRHTYVNRIKASDLTLFNLSVVTEEEADSLGLFKYPKINNIYDYPTILGDNISKEVQEKFKRLNAKFGAENQLRLWVLVFEDKPQITGSYQQNYWVNGNKNELVICIGINSENEITWTHSFSWAHSTTLTADVKNEALNLFELIIEDNEGNINKSPIPLVGEFRTQFSDLTNIDEQFLPYIVPNLNADNINSIKKSSTPILNDNTWLSYYEYLDNNLNRFERRSFEEFSYIKVELKKGNIIFLYILAFIISFGVNMWAYHNEIGDDNQYKKSNKKYLNKYNFKYKRFNF